MNITNNSSPELNNATNPHNMYLLIFVQLGIIGLLSMLSIFYYQIKLSLIFIDPMEALRPKLS